MLWVMLTGEHPFGETDSAVDYLTKHATEPIPSPLETHPHLVLQAQTEQLLARLLEKAQADRVPSAAALQRAVRTALRDLPDHLRDAPTPAGGIAPTTPRVAEAQTYDPSQLAVANPGAAATDPPTDSATPPPDRRPSSALFLGVVLLFTAIGFGVGVYTTSAPEPRAHIRASRTNAAAPPPVTPTAKAPPAGLPETGKPWHGIPIPAAASMTSNTPAAAVYQTTLEAQDSLDFYHHHMARYQPNPHPGGIHFDDPKSPLSGLAIPLSAMGRSLILTPNALVMKVQKTQAGDTVFGMPIYPGAVQVGLTPASAVYTVSTPLATVMAGHQQQIPADPGIGVYPSGENDEPKLILMNLSREDLTWKALLLMKDPSSPFPDHTQITVTHKK